MPMQVEVVVTGGSTNGSWNVFSARDGASDERRVSSWGQVQLDDPVDRRLALKRTARDQYIC
jgi:hypothetical protein